MRSVKMLAKHDEQSRFFGILDGGRGVMEAILATIAMSIFTFIFNEKTNNTVESLSSVIYMYSFICLTLALLIFIFLEVEKIDKSRTKKNKQNLFLELKQVLILKEIWVLSAIIFCGYSLYWTIYFFSGFLQANHNASMIVAGYITVTMLWMRPIGGILGGFLGDKFNRSYILIICLLTGSIGLIIISLLPTLVNNIIIFGFILIIGLMLYAVRGLYGSLLDNYNISTNILGFSIGIISFLGYLPDIITPMISGTIFNIYGDTAKSYEIFFLFSAGFGVLGAFITYFFNKHCCNNTK